MAELLQKCHVDPIVNVFEVCKDYFAQFTIAIYNLVDFLYQTSKCAFLPLFMKCIKTNQTLYGLAYFLFYYALLYWHVHVAARACNWDVVAQTWKYWFHVFIATHKWRYARITIMFLWTLMVVHSAVWEQIPKNMLAKMSTSIVASWIALDLVIEWVSAAIALFCCIFGLNMLSVS